MVLQRRIQTAILVNCGGRENSHTLGIKSSYRNEEVVSHLHVGDVGIVDLKLEAAEHHTQREIELRPCEPVCVNALLDRPDF